MANSALFLVCIANLLISTLSYCSPDSVYCVTPTATACSSCPQNSNHCATLSEYAQEAELYFTSKITMVFLSGNHTLNMNITVANVANLTMQGEDFSTTSATIVCNGSVGFNFISMVKFNIYSLAFTSCSRYHLGNFYALLLQSTQSAELVNCFFHDNLGTALVVVNTNVTLSGSTIFKHNHCRPNICFAGGGITAVSSKVTFTGNTAFLDNIGTFYGPTITTSDGGGAIYAGTSVLMFSGTNNFINNSVAIDAGCGAIAATKNTIVIFNGTNNFINNSADIGGAICISYNTTLTLNGTSNFVSNSATSFGGAIFANLNGTLIFNGTCNFINNGYSRDRMDACTMNGGGMYLGLKSTFSIWPHTNVYWEDNYATLGGAIYVRDTSPISYCANFGSQDVAAYIPKEECFFQLAKQNLFTGTEFQLSFKNNFADVAGSVLYGGAIDNCKLIGLDSYNSGKVFDMLVKNGDDTDYNTTSNISSEPLRICPCDNNLPYCSESPITKYITAYPGETFQVPMVAAGQRNGAILSAVRSDVDPGNLLGSNQYLQHTNNTCTKLNYTVSSLSQSVNITVQAEGNPCSAFEERYLYRIGLLQMLVHLNQSCPPGFNISILKKACVCEPRLAIYAGTHQCSITNGLGQIKRKSGQQFWVGYDDKSEELILHPHCPFGYCVNDTVVFSLNNTDIQCAYNRSGLLCGHCKESYSLLLGTSQCKQCTNSHLILLIPFALMGIALVFLLLFCKLTVATGTISGLLFYANIVGVNRTLFLPAETTDAFTLFIAWLNLDFGIETCFYDGMDTYSKTWLQFVFPVYILMIVGLIVLVSRFSSKFARVLGNNPVSVLSTLILLSYTKILRTLIAVLYVTYLEYPTYNSMVWLYDANIDYLSGKHIPLFLMAVFVLLFLFLPYTILLLFGQWLQAISHMRPFSWVNSTRLKAFMDSYHAPYKAKHRYWSGLLLVLRFVLFLVFAFEFNPQQDRTSINLLAILVGIGILVVWAWTCGGIHRNWCLDALEGSFALNLIILSATTMYIYHVSPSERDQLAVGYTSVSIAFATFIAILIFQVVKVTGIARFLKMKCAAARMIHDGEVEVQPQGIGSLPDRLVNPEEYVQQFYSPGGHTAAEPMENVNEAQRMQIPAYNYGSID